jgi:hypothetical protein
MKNMKTKIETLPNKRDKKQIDSLIRILKDNGGTAHINGNFNIDLSYIDNPEIEHEAFKGFFITVTPNNRDGSGISVKFDPYNIEVCSGLVETLEENGYK